MASYTRLGSYLLANELTADPFGKIHRGLTIAGSAFDRHYLVRTFSEEMLNAGVGAKLDEANRVASLLAGSRGFGNNYHIEAGRTPHVAAEYVPGRSLAQMLEKAKQEQIPLGVDHALSVLQGLAQALIQLHAKGVNHGLLSPHSIWVSFEGATQILDAPFAAVAQTVLPKCPVASASLARYRPTAPTSPLNQDFFALGAILYELLTFEKLPAQDQIPAALSRATLKAAQEESPLPPEILGLLNRLLMVQKPFENAGTFNAELERVLYDGDYSPTTFNMAFFMHTLFREDNEQDNQAMKADQAADYSPFAAGDAGSRSVFETSKGQNIGKYLVWAGGVVAVLIGILAYTNYESRQEAKKLQAELAKVQTQYAENEQKLADLSRQETMANQHEKDLEKKASEAKTVEERAKARKELEDARHQAEEIQRQKADALKAQDELKMKTQSIAQLASNPSAPKTEPKPAVVAPPAPTQPAPTPAQLPSATPPPVPVSQPAPMPTQPAPTPAAQPAAADVVETPPYIVKRVVPVAPRVNKNFLPAALRNTEIRIAVRVFIDAQGRPQKVQIVKGVEGSFGYNDSARDAALNSTYGPATKNGTPSTGWLNLDYNFGVPR